MTHRQHPEDDLHMTVAQFLDFALPEDACWTTVEHGGKRGKREAARLKAKGVKSGWPDIQILYRGKLVAIELKSEKGRLSSAQKAMHTRLRLSGALVYTATSLAAVEGFLSAFIPLRATTKARAV